MDYKSVSSLGSLVTKVQFKYSNGRLAMLDYFSAQADGSLKLILSHNFQYQGGNLAEMTSEAKTTPATASVLTTGRFTFDGSGRIATYAFCSPVEDPVFVQQYPVWDVTFNAKGNISQLLRRDYDKAGKLLSLVVTKYEYDEKPNPWYLPGEPEDSLIYFSVNNMTKITYENSSAVGFSEVYTYEYNPGKACKEI